MPTKIDEDKKARIISSYNAGISLAAIAVQENIVRSSVRRILRVNGVRDVTVAFDSVNLCFFDKIDSEIKAYFLGLMYADGNIYLGKPDNPQYAISLCLSDEDRYIVEKFRDAIYPGHKLYQVKKLANQQDQTKLLFGNRTVAEQLIALGCIPNKSLKLKMPSIDVNYINHFVRGYMDGDGCISVHSDKKGYIRFKVGFASTLDFCTQLKIIAENAGVDFHSKTKNIYTRKNGITSELIIGGNHQCYKFLEWIYKDSTIFLKRKHDKFLELCSWIDSNK